MALALLGQTAQAGPVLVAQYDWDSNLNGAITFGGVAGSYAPGTGQYNPFPSGSAAGHVAFANAGNVGWSTGLTMKANTVYTVTEAFGVRSDNASPGTNFNLRTARTLVVSFLKP